MIASQMAELERHYAKKKKETEKQAKVLAEGATGEEVVDRLYAFVHDELQDVPSSLYIKDWKKKSVDAILKVRAGDDFEKSYVLVQMLLSLDFEAEVVWVHDPDDGGFFPKYPNHGQLDVPLVVVKVEGREVWLDLGCQGCNAGSVQPRLSQNWAMRYDRNADELDEAVWEKSVVAAQSRHANPVIVYLDAVGRGQWNDLFPLDTNSRSGAAQLSEKVVISRDAEAGFKRQLHLTSTGLSHLYDSTDEMGAAEIAEDWTEMRFDDARSISLVSESPAGAEEFDVVLDLELDPVPAAMGETWILPPGLIYGTPSVNEWPTPRRSAFYIANDNAIRWEFRIPLPDGWSDAVVPGTQTLGVNCLEYSVHYVIENGDFVVRRILNERRGTVDAVDSVALIGRHAQAIRELELTPVVLTRKD